MKHQVISPYVFPGTKLLILPGKNFIRSKNSKSYDAVVIQKSIETCLGLDTLNTRSRKRHIVNGRFYYFYLCKKYTTLSLKEIGKTLGLDHTTVIHGLNTISDLLETDGNIVNELFHAEQFLIN